MKKLIFVFFLLASGVTTICACSVRSNVRGVDVHFEDFKRAQAVFIGKVIDVSVDERQITGTSRYDILYKIKFTVEKRWKGKASEITIVSDNGESDCGSFSFEIGKKYLVYAAALQDRLAAWATIGSPSRPLDFKDFRLKRRLKQLDSFRFRRTANLLQL